VSRGSAGLRSITAEQPGSEATLSPIAERLGRRRRVKAREATAQRCGLDVAFPAKIMGSEEAAPPATDQARDGQGLGCVQYPVSARPLAAPRIGKLIIEDAGRPDDVNRRCTTVAVTALLTDQRCQVSLPFARRPRRTR
jgi:hypothetical protein